MSHEQIHLQPCHIVTREQSVHRTVDLIERDCRSASEKPSGHGPTAFGHLGVSSEPSELLGRGLDPRLEADSEESILQLFQPLHTSHAVRCSGVDESKTNLLRRS